MNEEKGAKEKTNAKRLLSFVAPTQNHLNSKYSTTVNAELFKEKNREKPRRRKSQCKEQKLKKS